MPGGRFFYITVGIACLILMPAAWIRRKRELAHQEDIWEEDAEEKLCSETAVLVSKEARMIKTNRIYVNFEDSQLLQSNPRITAPGGHYPGHTVIYTATFVTDSGVTARHQVPYEIFDRLTEGSRGTLVTLNDAFLDFDCTRDDAILC